MSDDFIEIESKAELQDAINKTSMVILFCTVDGRDAVNASAGEEFEAAAEMKKNPNRTFVKMNGGALINELREIGVEMGNPTPYPKFVIFKEGKFVTAEDTAEEDINELIDKYRR